MLRWHTHFYINNWGTRFDHHAFYVFCNSWIVCSRSVLYQEEWISTDLDGPYMWPDLQKEVL